MDVCISRFFNVKYENFIYPKQLVRCSNQFSSK